MLGFGVSVSRVESGWNSDDLVAAVVYRVCNYIQLMVLHCERRCFYSIADTLEKAMTVVAATQRLQEYEWDQHH